MLIDGTFGSLDDDVLEIISSVFDGELKDTGVIHIGGPGEAHPLFSTVLHLVKSGRPDAMARAPAVPAASSQPGAVGKRTPRGRR